MTIAILDAQIAHLTRELLAADTGGYCPRYRKAALTMDLRRKTAQKDAALKYRTTKETR